MTTAQTDHVRYNFEYARKLRAAFIGAGGHAFRNIYPTFQYAPIELVAVCDLDGDRAAAYAHQFGAAWSFTDHQAMLGQVRPEVVFIVTAYDDAGRPQATRLALDALAAGCHVWMEKPTAASVADVRRLMAASRCAGRYVMTGLKKIFFPSIVKTKELIGAPEFGRVASLSLRYPQRMPALSERRDLTKVRGLLDHLPHPASIIHELMGPIEAFSYQWEPICGGSVATFTFRSGAVGTLHLVGGGSGTSPLEHLEVVGEHANVVVANGVQVTYYRPAQRPAYGRAASYLVDNDAAPLRWEPEFSLGQLYNKNIFSLGYVPEVLHFCESVLTATPPTKGTLAQSLEIAKLFEAYCTTPPGVVAFINAPQGNDPFGARRAGDGTMISDRSRNADAVRRTGEIAPLEMGWGQLVWLVGAAQTPGAEQTLGLVTIRPGQRNPLHRHPNCEELLYVLAGEAEHRLGDALFSMRAGDVIRIPRGTPHWARAMGDKPLVALVSFSSADRHTENLEEPGGGA